MAKWRKSQLYRQKNFIKEAFLATFAPSKILDSFQFIDETLVGYPRSFHETHQGLEPPMVEPDPTIAEQYDDQFTEMFIMPKIMVDYGTVKPGFYFYSGEIITRLSLSLIHI